MVALNKDQHLEKARQNETFFESVFGPSLQNNSGALDWATTVIFYTALHYVDALAVCLGRQFHNHEERRKFVDEPPLKPVAKQYKWLFDRSRDARYSFLDSSHTVAKVLDYKNRNLAAVRQAVIARLPR